MSSRYLPLIFLFSTSVSPAFAQTQNYSDASIVWDPATLVLVQAGGVYGRMVRLPNREILCSFELNGSIFVRRSEDEGRTWDDAVLAASFNFGNAANPEMLVLQNNTVLLSYNERPNDGIHPYTIKICFSQDGGATWGGYQLVYQAGTDSGTGCWEPAQIQLPSGEIQLYFSNENPYPTTDEQQITLIRSFDNGATWTQPEVASFRPGFRDGMPSPLDLNNGSGTVLAIEDNGLAGTFKPAIVTPVVDVRWAALQPQLPSAVYAGAPYLRQFPSGETVLSVQSADGRNNSGVLDYSRMVVYIGDSTAHGFTNASEPFAVPPTANGLWNSLFIKDATTVTAISGTTLNGVSGIWAIDGHLQYPNATTSPSINAVTNLASGLPGPVAPGELVSIAGSGLVPPNLQPGASVAAYFGGVRSPMAFASGNRITAFVPYSVSNAADVVLDAGTLNTGSFPLAVTSAAPEIFIQTDGSTEAVAANSDGSLNSPANPAARSTYVSFWATGQGQVSAAGAFPCPVLPVTVTVGGANAEVLFSGLIYPGVLQVNIKIPETATTGDAVGLVLEIGGAASRKTATLAVR